jgi:hypothetical protein
MHGLTSFIIITASHCSSDTVTTAHHQISDPFTQPRHVVEHMLRRSRWLARTYVLSILQEYHSKLSNYQLADHVRKTVVKESDLSLFCYDETARSFYRGPRGSMPIWVRQLGWEEEFD